jgi:DNA-binding CsgD family transcriptional regulator
MRIMSPKSYSGRLRNDVAAAKDLMCSAIGIVSEQMTADTLATLTPRQRQCIHMASEAMSTLEIAQATGISARAVNAQFKQVYMKFGRPTGIVNGISSRIAIVNSVLDLAHEPPGNELCGLFSEKQIGLLDSVRDGLTNSKMAAIFGNTERVIKNYLRVLFEISGTNSRIELAIWWRNHRGDGRGRVAHAYKKTA